MARSKGMLRDEVREKLRDRFLGRKIDAIKKRWFLICFLLYPLMEKLSVRKSSSTKHSSLVLYHVEFSWI